MQSSGGSTSKLKVPHRPRSRILIVIAERRVIYISSTFPSLQWLYKKVAWHRRGNQGFPSFWSLILWVSTYHGSDLYFTSACWMGPLESISMDRNWFSLGQHSWASLRFIWERWPSCLLHSWLGGSHGYKAPGSLVTLAWTSTKNCWQNVREITQSSQFRCPDNLPIHAHVDGGVVKLYKTFFGVKSFLHNTSRLAELTANDQHTRLLVSDSKALHFILVKVCLRVVAIWHW